MPRNPDAKLWLLKAIYDLKFATIYNLAFESRGTTKDSCLVGTGRHIRQLEKAGLILPVRQYGYLRHEKYRHTFWQVTKDGAQALGYERYTPVGEKSVRNFPHQFGLVDALCGLYYPFRDEYDIAITYPSTADSLDGYKPDAVVKYRHKLNGREYDFILEFERTRTPKEIMEEKIRVSEKVKNFRKFGLSKQTKILYVFTTENFDVTKRPVEYEDCRPVMERVEKQFGQLLRLAGKLPGYRYRFLILYQYRSYKNAVWVIPGGELVKIII
ncbi:replication-relaxation family protein [bacterium]|nr:replication-relaxation family protein [bacterium]